LKEGSLGYEDEKFCYLIASKTPGALFSNRIIRHPLKQSGHVRLTLCTDQGKIEEKTISRKDKSLYRQARDSEWGDCIRDPDC
jgi:ribosomal protein RSM22 (predicted rRNA methylase)